MRLNPKIEKNRDRLVAEINRLLADPTKRNEYKQAVKELVEYDSWIYGPHIKMCRKEFGDYVWVWVEDNSYYGSTKEVAKAIGIGRGRIWSLATVTPSGKPPHVRKVIYDLPYLQAPDR